MITKEQATPGATVLYKGKETTVLTGSYNEERLGWMVKTSLHPGGYPADQYDLPGEPLGNTEQLAEIVPAVTFELSVLDEVAPIKLTAELIRQKSKVLTDLTIVNYLDEKGYDAVKKAKQKAVKMRTAIEGKEKEILDAMKLRHTAEKKEVTDYTAELYVACREAQTALEAKLTVIDNAKKEAADKLAADDKARTEGRDNAMYAIGMTFNGQAFVGYGKSITKNSLYSLSAEAYAAYLTELEGLQIEQGVTGEVKTFVGGGMNTDSDYNKAPDQPIVSAGNVSPQKPMFDNAVYEKTIGGVTFFLTKGEVIPIDGMLVTNERVMQSAIFVNVILSR